MRTKGRGVRKGVLLVELDDTIALSEVRRIETGLREARRTARRLHLLAAGPPPVAPGRRGRWGPRPKTGTG